nr:acyltransferase [Pedobacter sp. ASV2]
MNALQSQELIKKETYYPYIDSLRAISCFFVIIFHSYTIAHIRDVEKSTLFQGGYIGVDLFFVLSGFLITKNSINQYISKGTFKIGTFYLKRILRLYPPLLIATLIFLVPLLFYNSSFALSNAFFLLTYTGDCVLLFQKIWPSLQYPSMFSHCWSLAVEEQYYLIFPLLFIYITKKFWLKRNITTTFPLFNSVFLALVILLALYMDGHFYKFFLWRFFQIFFGGYIAFFFSKNYLKTAKETKFSKAIVRFISAAYKSHIIAVAALFIFFIIFIFSISFDIGKIQLHYFILTLISSIIIFNAYSGENWFYKKLLNNKALMYLGKISYGLYLFHSPVFYFKTFNIFKIPTTLQGSIFIDIVSIITTIILAVISYEVVEKRALSYKNTLA